MPGPNFTKEDYIRVMKRMLYEQLIKGHKNEEEFRKKDDKHVDEVLKRFNIKVDYNFA